MRVMEIVKQEFESGNMLLFYSCNYKRRLKFGKKPKHKRVDFNCMKYYNFKSKGE